MRIGPFHSKPGDWHTGFSGEDAPGRIDFGLFEPGDRITAFVGHAVTDDGTPIGFPPLHIHHIHMRKGSAFASREHADHWFESHGDYSRGSDVGIGARSAIGYVTRVPAGYCVVTDEFAHDVDVNAQVNDRWHEVAPGRVTTYKNAVLCYAMLCCAGERRAQRRREDHVVASPWVRAGEWRVPRGEQVLAAPPGERGEPGRPARALRRAQQARVDVVVGHDAAHGDDAPPLGARAPRAIRRRAAARDGGGGPAPYVRRGHI
jgi:hypothetical protein